MTQTELMSEVASILDRRVEAKLSTVQSWLVQEVVASHPGLEGIDADFYLLCAQEHVRDTVGSVLRKRYDLARKKDDAQRTLPGYEYLQTAYRVERGEEMVVVPTDDMTIPEAEEKVRELRAMGEGCFKHARELCRYFHLDDADAA